MGPLDKVVIISEVGKNSVPLINYQAVHEQKFFKMQRLKYKIENISGTVSLYLLFIFSDTNIGDSLLRNDFQGEI